MLLDYPAVCRQVTMVLAAGGCPGVTTRSGPAFQPRGRRGEVNLGSVETRGSAQGGGLQLGQPKAAAGALSPGLWAAAASSEF